MFMFKKIVGPLFYPVPLCLEILLLGLFLLWFTRRQRAGKAVVTVGVGLLAFFSFSWGSNLLLKPLEHRYPPLMQPPASQPVKWIVALGGGINPDPQLPITSRITEASLYRILEGVRLYRQVPGSKLLLSGGAVFNPPGEAEGMAEIARILGVDPRDLVLETASRDTEDQARLIKGLVGRDKFILVTSASHLPRSMALFQKQGLHPIPAPAGHFVHQESGAAPHLFFPGAKNVQGAEAAVHEYLGLAWARLRGAL
jgi:uncharacterized SAM-binding protein YcdF (DUF218 family)